MSFSNERAQGPAQKPNIVAVLGNIIYGYQREGVLAYEMPNDPAIGANWFMKVMEPQQRWEGMQLKQGKDAKEFWSFPYLERLAYLLKRYYHLPDSDQAIIIGCCEEEVYWRGESIDHFYNSEHSVYNEITAMRDEGIKSYQPKAVELFKTLDFGMKKGEKPPSVADEEPDIKF